MKDIALNGKGNRFLKLRKHPVDFEEHPSFICSYDAEKACYGLH